MAECVSTPGVDAAQPRPSLAIIIPAWNEADYLPGTLAATTTAVEQLAEPVEIIVVDNASTDATGRIAAAHGARVVAESEHRIARVRNAGAAAARAPFLLFIDADTRVTGEHLAAVLHALRDGWAGGGAPIGLDHGGNRFYATGVAAWNRLARALGLAAGSFVFARAELHHAIGGFDERVYAGEEIAYSRRLARLGRRRRRRFALLDTAPVISSARKLDWFPVWQHVLVLLLFLVFPWAGRFKRLTWFWYRRPRGTTRPPDRSG